MRTLPLVLVAGCWVLSEDDLARHDRDRPPPAPSPGDPPSGGDADGEATDDDTFPAAVVALPCAPVAFTPLPPIALPGDGPRRIVAGDVDTDTLTDLVTTAHAAGTVTYALGRGDGTFELPAGVALPAAGLPPQPLDVVLVELDGDRAVDDVVVLDGANGLVVLLQEDARALAVETTIAGSPGARALVGGFLDLDDEVDFAVVTDDGALDLHLGDGVGGFTSSTQPLGGRLVGLAAADLDGDTREDLAIADEEDDTVELWTAQGDGTFAVAGAVPSDGPVTGLVLADADGDSALDLVVAGDGNELDVWLFDALFAWQEAPPSDVRSVPAGLATGDFHGDRCLSAVVANAGEGSFSFLRGRGDGTFDGPVRTDVDGDPEAVVVVQLDGDGTPLDVAVAGTAGDGEGFLQVFLGSAP